MEIDSQQYQKFEKKYFYLPKIFRKKTSFNEKLYNNLKVRKYNNHI